MFSLVFKYTTKLLKKEILPPREGLGLLLCAKLAGGRAAEEGGGTRGSELKCTGVRELGGGCGGKNCLGGANADVGGVNTFVGGTKL